MSLKTFHIVFITLSTLLSWGFAAWCFVQFHENENLVYATAALFALIASGMLVLYGRRFLHKMKDVGYF